MGHLPGAPRAVMTQDACALFLSLKGAIWEAGGRENIDEKPLWMNECMSISLDLNVFDLPRSM